MVLFLLFVLNPLSYGSAVSAPITFAPGLAASNTSTLAISPNVLVANGTSTASITFTAKDSFGNSVPNTAVTLTPSGANNTLGAASGTTNASGVFSTTLSSTLAQSESVAATFGSSSSTSASVQFVAGSPSSLTSTLTASPNSQIADNSNYILAVLTLKDANGNPVAGITPIFTTSASNTTVSSPATTSAAGQSSARYQSSLAQNANALATASGLSFSIPIAFVAGPATAAASTLVANPNIAAGNGTATLSLLATARDAQGNLVGNTTVSLMASGPNNTFAAANGNTASNGTYATTLKSTQMQTETITATIGGTETVTTSVTFTGPASALTSSLTTNPNTQTVGPANTVTATLTLMDAASNPLAGVSSTWTASGGSNTIIHTGNTTSTGTATASYSSTLAQNENVQVTAGGLSLIAPLTYVAGPASPNTSLAYAKPGRQLANNSNSITVYALFRDVYNNPLVNQPAIFSASGSSTTISNTKNTDSTGTATAAYQTASAQNVNAIVGNGNVLLTQPLIFTSVPTSCTLSANTTSAAADGNASIVLTATVLGGAGNSTAIPGVVVSFSSLGGANKLVPSSAITSSSGIATSTVTSLLGGPNQFLAQAGGIQCAAQGNFTFQSRYCVGNPNYTLSTVAVGSLPVGITSADLNGDGSDDIIVANTSSQTVGVLMGNANGTFRPQVTYALPAQVWGVAAGDLDGDGYVDVVASLPTANAIYVFAGSPNGVLSLKQAYATTNPIALTLVDIDRDGALDILVGNSSAGTVSVLLGTGSGPFLAGSTYPAGTYPGTSFGVGDFNGDGIADVAIGNSGGQSCSVLLGATPGTFQAPLTLSVSSSGVNGLALGDLDADGHPDLVATGGNPNVDVLFGSASGTFSAYRSLPLLGGGTANYVKIDDLNGDGIPDILVPQPGTPAVSIVLGTGSGSFSAPYSTQKTGGYPYGIVTGDFNKDGKRDFAVSSKSAGAVYVFLYSGCN